MSPHPDTTDAAGHPTASKDTPDAGSMVFQKLLRLAPDLLTLETGGISRLPFNAPLYLDIHDQHPDRTIIFLAQYYRSSSGDLIPAPEMEIAILPSRHTAKILACHEPDGSRKVDGEGGSDERTQAERELVRYLDQWLDQLLAQGHCIRPKQGAGDV